MVYVKLPEGYVWLLDREPLDFAEEGSNWEAWELQFQSGSPKGRAFVGLKHPKDGGLIIFLSCDISSYSHSSSDMGQNNWAPKKYIVHKKTHRTSASSGLKFDLKRSDLRPSMVPPSWTIISGKVATWVATQTMQNMFHFNGSYQLLLIKDPFWPGYCSRL